MKNISEFLVVLVDLAWGTPLVILLLGGGAVLITYSKFINLRGFFHAFKLISGKFRHKGDEKAEGQISHFQALTNALSATIGMGNIAGVAVALTQGGPGAIFWMWLAGLVGMNTKFFECTLSLLFRGRDHEGEVQGGPMYTIVKALPKQVHFLGGLFAIFGMVGTLALYNSNQVTAYMAENYGVPKLGLGIAMAVFVAYVMLGGVKRIAGWTSKIVPSMCLVYVIACLGILFLNIEKIPSMFMLIFSDAFTGKALFGGAAGSGIMMVFRIGIKRAAFSNEAGIGTAPMAHGNAHTSEPVAEGLVAMVGPFLDTIVVCTMTALAILISVPDYASLDLSGVLLTGKAFESTYGGLGTHLLGIAVFLFSFSTIIGTANYNKKCWDFLFKGHKLFRKHTFVVFYAITVIVGSVNAPGDMINVMDIAFAFMAVPNMIATLWLAPHVKRAMDEYFKTYLA